MKILMVCLGNICRSPMADGLLRKKVTDNQLNVIVDSAGTASYHVGDPPDARMRQTAQAKGFPIDELRARQFVQQDFDNFDLIYAMDRSNFTNIERLARNDEDKAKIRLILDETFPNQNMEVPDPYYGGEQGFIDVFNLLDEATNVILENLKTKQ